MRCFIGKCAVALGVAAAAGIVSQPLHAASSWLSTVTTINDGKTETQMASSLPGSLYAGSQSAESIFNLTISLEENPSGDDLYPDDPGSSDDAQNRFEAKIEEFSDAVYQMTNGVHKIGKVTIFRNGAQADNVDVKWTENCLSSEGPRAHPSGFGVPGKRIWFCTNWPGSSTMDTPTGAGFTLAHEWGHYAYGVYDEYVGSQGCVGTNCPRDSSPWSSDTPSEPSIMNNQWRAAGSSGDRDYLEFSTEAVVPYSVQADGDDNTAHARVFAESGWKTLTRDSATDPRHSYLPARTQFTNLVAPPASTPIINDNESTARSELEIIWAGEQVVELMIDTSGSMSGTAINNARTAANLLVGQLTPGENAIGVGRFSSSSSQVFAITDIPDPDTGVRSSAQTAISVLTAGGGTDIEGAALSALAEVQAFQGGQRPSVVFLLTDGISSVTVANVVNQYVAARVPLITFGFGSNVDATLLQNLADGTGGQYFYSPTSLQEIQQAFLAANAAFSSNSVVTSSSASMAASTTEVRPIHLDSTLDTASINVSYGLAESDISLRLLDSSGSDTGNTFICNSSSEVSCDMQVDVPANGAGIYGVEITNNTGAEKDVSILVSATPNGFDGYHMALATGNTSYPEDLTLRATVAKGPTLSGLSVTAIVTRPDSSTFDLVLHDDGNNADLVADDGTYSADVPYDNNGIYTAVVTASNENGQARTAYDGIAVTVKEDGTEADSVSRTIPEAFTRVSVVTMSVAQFSSDDHSDDPSAPSACTSITDDNLDTAGLIDSSGDVDCFLFQPTSTGSQIVVRATDLRRDMLPVMRIFDAAGTTELMVVDLATSSNADSGVIALIPSSTLDAAGHVVTIEHASATAASGGYAVSVGAEIASDNPVINPPTPPPSNVTCNGLAATIVGTSGDDVLEGTSGDDVIVALGGNDAVYGKGGDDTICGHAGDDLLYGGRGEDTIYGGDGNDMLAGSYDEDYLSGGNGDDRLIGSYNDDRLVGGKGNDRLYGNAGHDILQGGPGDDIIVGSYGADIIQGGDGDDIISADSNNDVVRSGAGRDVVDGGSGHDRLYGGADDDELHGGTGYDQLVGGPGSDTCAAQSLQSLLSFNLLDSAIAEDAHLFADGSDEEPQGFLELPPLHPTKESATSCETETGY